MTGPQHYREGERILALAHDQDSDIYPTGIGSTAATRAAVRTSYATLAAAHFAAAQAAAAALAIKDDGYGAVPEWRGAVLPGLQS